MWIANVYETCYMCSFKNVLYMILSHLVCYLLIVYGYSQLYICHCLVLEVSKMLLYFKELF